ncbi:hypothetical protein ATANTOWER_015714 [Ataeniobius toweri]|uniref:Uncharacterized protein n=1 Tax=Ataeniobius toweri TaxID=208326 RepID=A0ABU7BRI4_9TELE|nr:hypothetical protein [Ataeniobius toweri]
MLVMKVGVDPGSPEWVEHGGGRGCLKVSGRGANWDGDRLMSFSVLFLPWTGGITSPSCQSRLCLLPQPVEPSFLTRAIFIFSYLHCSETEGEKQEKTVYF